MRGRSLAVALATLVALGVTPAADAQSESSSPGAGSSPAGSIAPPADTAPGASIDGVRDGWTLAANEDPTFSVQLPPGWTQGATTSGIAATSAAGEALTATPESLPDEADFDAWVTRVETDLESTAKDNLLTTFREVGTGVVARIDEGTSGRAAEGQVTAHFLFSLCAEGALTMDITGPAPVPTEGGAPDAWDDIASGVNPCAADPAPERVLDPEVAAAAPRYLALVAPRNAAVNRAYEPLAVDTTLKVWRKQSAIIGRIVNELVAELEAETWPASVQPLVDDMIAANEKAATLWGKTLAKAKDAKGITSHYDDLDEVNAGTLAAGRVLRFALGLPSLPR